ncbi:radical SAM protein [Litorisediminicola beolgyonensis]|uniref:Radical SAM protein n=1 Tax=Litorisediminicola beolgyonensis TaxID=1173614 RepID=A0ABW3ZGW7_9RHOB
MPDGARPPAEALIEAGRPRHPDLHLAGDMLLLSERAAVYGLRPDQAALLSDALASGTATEALARFGLDAPAVTETAEGAGPVRALALTVSQSCNMACGYCYAAGGSFGGPEGRMTETVARAAIDRLLAATPPGGAVKIAFMGGEPFVARKVIHDAVSHARRRAAARAISVGFSITTNGTLLTEADAEFLAANRFAVTVSLDGGRAVQDRLRPMRGGDGSFDRIARALAPLLARQDSVSLSARMTVTPENLGIGAAVADLGALGFHSVGMSPMLSSPTGRGALGADEFPVLLSEMVSMGEDWLQATLAGQPHPFANLATALGEIHRGATKSFGCGAARDYLAVDAEGDLSACHRFVRDPLGAMGSLQDGIDDAARVRFLGERRVEAQDGCRSCWARRLCGGGCHQEVLHAGRPACDFVRGWLSYALGAYGRLIDARPDWFDAAA